MSDDELMKKVAAGDSRAFKLLFDRHSGKVFGYARRLVGDRERAEDVSQEVWMKIIKNAPAYKPTSQFIAWIFTIVRNGAFNQLRNLKNLKEDASENTLDFSRIDLAAEKKNIEELLAQEDDAKKIRSKIDELPENQRILLTAWMTEDLSYEELARETGFSLAAVKSLLFRAKRAFEVTLRGLHG